MFSRMRSSSPFNIELDCMSEEVDDIFARHLSRLKETDKGRCAMQFAKLFDITHEVDNAFKKSFIHYLDSGLSSICFKMGGYTSVIKVDDTLKLVVPTDVTHAASLFQPLFQLPQRFVDEDLFRKALLLASLLRNCGCGYSCSLYCPITKFKEKVSEPTEFFAQCIWKFLAKERVNWDMLLRDIVKQLKPEQKAQLATFMEGASTPENFLMALNSITGSHSPPMLVGKLLSLWDSQLPQTTGVSISGATSIMVNPIPRLSDQPLIVRALPWYSLPTWLTDVLASVGMSAEERAVKEAEKRTAAAAAAAELYSRKLEVIKSTFNAEKLLKTNKLYVETIVENSDTDEAALRELIVQLRTELNGLPNIPVIFPTFCERIHVVQQGMNELITRVEQNIISLRECKEREVKEAEELATVNELFLRFYHGTLSDDIQMTLLTALLQWVIYRDSWTPCEQNKSPDELTTSTVKHSKVMLTDKLTKFLMPLIPSAEINPASDGTLATMTPFQQTIAALVGLVMGQSEILFSEESEEINIHTLFTTHIGFVHESTNDVGRFCWHCGKIFGVDLVDKVPETLTKKQRRNLSYKHGIVHAFSDHLRDIGSIGSGDTLVQKWEPLIHKHFTSHRA